MAAGTLILLGVFVGFTAASLIGALEIWRLRDERDQARDEVEWWRRRSGIAATGYDDAQARDGIV